LRLELQRSELFRGVLSGQRGAVTNGEVVRQTDTQGVADLRAVNGEVIVITYVRRGLLLRDRLSAAASFNAGQTISFQT
jgi:hypothetical protein